MSAPDIDPDAPGQINPLDSGVISPDPATGTGSASPERIQQNILDLAEKQRGGATKLLTEGEDNEHDVIDRMGELVKRSIDYTLILALAGLGILSTVIFRGSACTGSTSTAPC